MKRSRTTPKPKPAPAPVQPPAPPLPLAQRLASAREGYLLWGVLALRIRPASTYELSQVGAVELAGASAAIAAEDAAKDAAMIALITDGVPPEEAARRRAKIEEQKANARESKLSRLAGTEQGAAALHARATAHLCAAVDGAHELPKAYPLQIVRTLPEGAGPLEPLRLVTRDADADPAASRVWVDGLMSVEDRVSLGLLVIAHMHSSLLREVTPFRRAP